MSLHDYEGSYQAESGKHILLMTNGQRLSYLEPDKGDFRIFASIKTDTFICGSGVKHLYPPETTALFLRDASSSVTAIRWQQAHSEVILERKPVYSYEDITFTNGSVQLVGQLTKPTVTPPYPAVVMVPGSGPQSRYELQPLAEYFASLGIAVLSYDKRGVGRSSGYWQAAAYDDLAQDVLAGFIYLQSRLDIQRQRVGLWGISQGAWLISMVAAGCPDIAFIIPVSGPGVPPAQQEIWRVEHLLRADGFSQAVIEKAISLKQLSLMVGNQDNAAWQEFLASVIQVKNENWFAYLGFETNPTKDALYEPPFEPLDVFTHVRCPVLAIFGERDPFLPVQQSVIGIKQALWSAQNADTTVRIISGGNHMLFSSVTGGLKEQPTLPGFVPYYLSLMREWLLKHTSLVI